MSNNQNADVALAMLVDTIAARRRESADKSYTRQLLDGGPAKCAKKLGEEAIEVVLAAVNEDDEAMKNEAADLVYHLLVLLEARDIKFADVLDVLGGRMGVSGLEEKAARHGNS